MQHEKKNIFGLSKKKLVKKGPKAGNSSRNSSEIVLRFSSDLEHLFFTDSLFSFFDFKKKDLHKTSLSEAGYLKGNTKLIEDLLLNSMELGDSISIEIQLDNSDWIHVSVNPEPNEFDEIDSVICVIRDINSEKQSEQQLQEEQQRTEFLLKASDSGSWEWVIESESMFLSRKWKSQLGYYPDELGDDYSGWLKLVHDEDFNRIKREMENFQESKSLIFESIYRARHKDGTIRWFKNRSIAKRDELGKAIKLFGMDRDITAEKEQEEKLSMLQQTFTQTPAAVAITDLDGYIVFFNPAFCKITGYSADEIIGKKTSILKSGFHSRPFYKNLWDTILTGNEWRGELKHKSKDGNFYWERALISSLRNEKGIITNYLKIAEDVSPVKKLQDNLRKSREISKTAALYKNNFLKNISHEIRTPVNGIIGFSELLKYADLSTDQQLRYIEIIEENSKSLLNLIDDVIDISMLEADELRIKKEACSITAVFSELKDIFQDLKEEKNKDKVELIVKAPEAEHHDFIFTDPFRLKQIISNLYLNALAFTHSGSIEVGYKVASDKVLQFYVKDTGIGILPKDQKSIFQRVIQNDHSMKVKDSGAGLGLYISQGLVQLLGGSIGVSSIIEKGSLFYFTIPYDKIRRPVQSAAAPKRKEYDFSQYTILIAEDVDYNFEYLNEILSDTKANVLWAKDGIDTINLYNNNKIDLILMDIQLPEINGYEVTKTIRKENKEIPIIAQTAYAMNHERKKCIQSGCNSVLTKPLKIHEVLNTLAKYLK